MSTRVLFTEITETRAELRVLPEKMAGATQALAMRIARDARADIKAAYPRSHKRFGKHLADGLIIVKGYGAGKVVASASVINTNPIAHNFEHGIQTTRKVRRLVRGRGANWGLERGPMRAGNVFIPRIVRWRWVFFRAVKEIMEAEGITVTGEG